MMKALLPFTATDDRNDRGKDREEKKLGENLHFFGKLLQTPFWLTCDKAQNHVSLVLFVCFEGSKTKF